MAGAAETTTLGDRRCRKHAFAARAFRRTLNGLSAHAKTARKRAFCPSRRLRHASDIPVTGDDPVNEKDPTGLTWGFTYGVCGNAEAEIGFGIGGVGAQGQPCALHTNRSDLTSQDGVSFTVGVTFLNLGGGAALSAYFLVSNASSISQMRGPFAAVAASVFGWGGAVFWGLDNSGSPNGVFGFEGGPGIGPEADIGFWMQYSWTYTVPTWISRVVSLVSGNPITAFADSNGFGVDRRRELLAEAQHQLAEDQAKYAGRTNLGGCPEPG
jgi:hypothetical protein